MLNSWSSPTSFSQECGFSDCVSTSNVATVHNFVSVTSSYIGLPTTVDATNDYVLDGYSDVNAHASRTVKINLMPQLL